MSVFRVKLNNLVQGTLDTSGATSIQRTYAVTGPNGITRYLADGETFTDSNYYMKFVYPTASAQDAFLEVVSDDGSVYSEVDAENTYPRVYNLLVQQGTAFTDNVVDVFTDTGSYAVFAQIVNQGATAVRVRINGVSNSVFDLAAGATQIFNPGDMRISKLEFLNNVSGGVVADVQVLLSIKSVSTT
jgi:hypothetical protein